jgi:hypothetical protein
MSQYYIILASNDNLPRVVWSKDKLRVIAESPTGNKNQAIAHVEFNHGPNGVGEDAWVEINSNDTSLFTDVLEALTDIAGAADIKFVLATA